MFVCLYFRDNLRVLLNTNSRNKIIFVIENYKMTVFQINLHTKTPAAEQRLLIFI